MTKGRKKLGIVRTLRVKLDKRTAEALAFLLENGEEIEESSLIRTMVLEQRRLFDLRDNHGGLRVLDSDNQVNLVSIGARPVDFGMMMRSGSEEP
jgi:hypothetical protein